MRKHKYITVINDNSPLSEKHTAKLGIINSQVHSWMSHFLTLVLVGFSKYTLNIMVWICLVLVLL